MRLGVDRVCFIASVLLTGLTALGAGCSSKSGTAACALGAEGCDCTTGGACDPGLICRSHLCVNPVPTGAGTGGGAPTGSAGMTGTAGTTGTGATTGTAGATGTGATTGAGGTGASGSAGSSGGGGSGASALVCPYPATTGKITEISDPTGQSKDTFMVAFSGGRLTTMDGKACAIDKSGVKPTGDWGSYPCVDAFSCDGCLMFLLDEKAPSGSTSTWTLLGAYTATNGATAGCAQYSGAYRVCVPNCTVKTDGGTMVKVCGSDGCGGSCGFCGASPHCCNGGMCSVDKCAECTSACNGIPGCVCTSVCATQWCTPD